MQSNSTRLDSRLDTATGSARSQQVHTTQQQQDEKQTATASQVSAPPAAAAMPGAAVFVSMEKLLASDERATTALDRVLPGIQPPVLCVSDRCGPRSLCKLLPIDERNISAFNLRHSGLPLWARVGGSRMRVFEGMTKKKNDRQLGFKFY